MNKSNQGFSSLIGLLITAVLFGAGFVLYQKTVTTPIEPQQAVVEEVDVPGDWIKHEDPRGFSYSVPPSWWYGDGDNIFLLYPPNHVPAGERQSGGGVLVYPITELEVSEDPSSQFLYDSVKKQFLHRTCEDFDLESYCLRAKQVTVEVVEPNVTVGGIPSYAIQNQSPSYHLVPINSKYGILINLSLEADGLSPTLQKILDSFRFSEPSA